MKATQAATTQAPIALTMGDAAGIGPEIIVRLFQRHPDWSQRCVVIGSGAALRRAAQLLGGAPIAELADPLEAANVPPGAIPLWPVVELHEPLPPWGQVNAAAGRAAAEAVERAAQAALRGEVAAVVTAPLSKAALAAAGVPYPGHTELLQAVAARHLGVPVEQLPVRMMLSNRDLRTVLVSIHVPLRQALDWVTGQRLDETLRLTHVHFTRVLGWGRCRIAVAGLNPHAGEGGLLGREELDIIAPAVERARAAGMDVHGPLPADTVFWRARQGEFDVVVAQYHDQGLIAIKSTGLADGVNSTLGLPFVRTSPDHGTAFDIAGRGCADPASMEAAVQAAWQALASGRHAPSVPLAASRPETPPHLPLQCP
ncbi:4-hydroxythreonine-4-phosphate dehydrogenase 2 [Tepidimonas alkaliphilus]|uniref:4-hydroxythreonine-4-phosphate dehydrogenase 2 n=1 Tax=Tepidimonas alkaliphilus TaxID=2588942 RepID=A0A554W9K2_9BURK|nr:4-hydroxythreonine-4-phosphate dehydrogenase PdxA [Tepidimonas alkaliphilus]TSE20258.1 4-hydroxythreonine-4-phosphate dehydrogenase 2 [Tepidimonas alkaliphilus]